VSLLDAGCPVQRHELTDVDWLAVGTIKAEREKLNAPTPEQQGWQKVPETE